MSVNTMYDNQGKERYVCMRGQKINEDIKERARALLAVNNNLSAVARELNIPITTLTSWKKKFDQDDDNFAKLRNENKKKFIDNAWKIILLAQNETERVLEMSKGSNTPLVDLSKLATVIGVMYDKQALAQGDSTCNLGGQTVEEMLRKVEGKKEF